MIRLISRVVCFALIVSFVCFSVEVQAAVTEGADLAVYNSGRAQVTESRSVTLPEGLASVVFKNVPMALDPTSIRAEADGMRVLDVEYHYQPVSRKSLLDAFIGKELNVIMPDPVDANARILRKATLLSNTDGPVFQVGNEVYLGDYDVIMLPELPKGSRNEPSLTLTTEAVLAGKRDVQLEYLMSGLNWQADYVLVTNKAATEGALDAWATLTNTSGQAFNAAALKLVAGEVHREQGRRGSMLKSAMVMEAASGAPQGMVQADFSQYHVYSLERRVTLASSGTKQFNLFSAPQVSIKQQLVSTYHTGNGLRNGPLDQNVDLTLTMHNTAEAGAGHPMPAGLVRVFMPTSDEDLLLAGESRIGHVGVGGEAVLSLGTAFDVTVRRTQKEFKKLGKNSYEVSWDIEIQNSRPENQSILLRETFSGQWEIINSSKDFTRPDAGTMEYALAVPPMADGKPMHVEYTVQVTY